MAAPPVNLDIVLVLGAVAALAACTNPQATIHDLTTSDPTKPYIGMSKAALMACIGPPHARYPSGDNSETLTYHYSGAGPTKGASAPPQKSGKKPGLAGALKKKGDSNWTCTASLVFENDRLVRLAYAHKDVRSPYAYMDVKDPRKREELKDAPPPSCSFVLPPSCGR
jgi:hypothetical protein